MSRVSVTAQISLPVRPRRAFEMFAAGEILGAECAMLSVGTAIALSMPIDGLESARGTAITILGHVAQLHDGHSVSIVHHQPWAGRITVRFMPDATGTKVFVESQIDGDGIDWLVRRRGFNPPERATTGSHPIGLLLSKSGSAAVFAQSTQALAELAVDEINADGGIGALHAELQIGDDASNAAVGAAEAIRLLEGGCRALFACVTSATFNAVARALRGSGILLVHTVLNEGGPHLKNVLRLGERPRDQVTAGVPMLMRETGARRWFLVGQRYSWSYGAHMSARKVIAEAGGVVAGEEYVELGTTDFAGSVDRIRQSGADLILTSLVGHDEVHFERTCARAGLRNTTRTLALALDEATLQLIGADHADGVWAAFGYFESLGAESNRPLTQRYRNRSGPWLPPMTSFTESTYEAILAYSRAANPGQSSTTISGPDMMSALRSTGKPDLIGRRQLLEQPIYLAEASGAELIIRERLDTASVHTITFRS